MAATYSCDGCGSNVAEPKHVGYVLKRDYCPECADKAKAFLDAVEVLQKTAQDQFATARQAFINQASEGGFKLPDTP